MEEVKKEEKQNEKKPKKGVKVVNIILYAVLILLGLAVCAYASYKIGYEYGSHIAKEENVKEEREENKPKYEVPTGLTENSQIVKDVMRPFFYSDCHVDLNKLDETETRMQVTLTEVKKSEVLCKNVEPKFFFDEGIPYVCNEIMDTAENVKESEMNFDESRLTNETTEAIDANEFKSVFQKIFGLNSKYQNSNFKYFVYTYRYDSENNRYIRYIRPRTGGTCSGGEDIRSTTVNQNGKNLTVTYKYDSNEITYTFTFEEETGNYIFVSRVVR